MRRLIINADDLGMNPQRSHGIFECVEQGIVTNATLIPNQSHSAQAAKHARERDVPTGLHLNLTDGSPISNPDDVASLLDAQGNFREREQQHRLLDKGDVEDVHIERELRAQVEWFLDHHGAPTHLDGHHHIQIHPVVVPLLIPIMQRYGISLVRLPSEPLPPFGFEISPDHLAKSQAISSTADAARPLYEANGISSTDHFRGLALVHHASAKNLRHILGRLPEGTTELMVHPGSPAAIGTPFDLDPQRQTEMRMLTDESIPALLAERKIELCSYADLA